MHDPNDPYYPLDFNVVTVDSPLSISTHDSMYTDTITSFDLNTLNLDDIILTGPTSSDTIELDNSLYIGSAKIDEQKIKLLDALIETINNLPEDNELRSLFENVQMLNKMKNAD